MAAAKPAPDALSVEMARWALAFCDGRERECIAWLEEHGCRLVCDRTHPLHPEYTEYHLDGVTRIRCGLGGGSDALTTAMQISLLVTGAIRPELAGLISQEWDVRRKAKGRA